ncbi:MAG TPA: DUF1697 domain-containing protein [Allosphingosinicella sp.]|nr:DUF1697 domain-containing protein [Allosphingosinicella sp.]
MTRMVALLRAVNVGGRKLPMAELRGLCAEMGWKQVSTYIQSGNLLFSSASKPLANETALEQAIEARFRLKVPVMVRTASVWSALRSANPFPAVARASPSRLMLILPKSPPAADAEAVLQARATAGEQVKRAGDVIWIHFPEGAGRSKLTPSVIDRAIGSPATARNYRTVAKLEELLAE